MKMRSAREAARVAARPKRVRGSIENDSSSSSVSEESAVVGRPGQRRRVKNGVNYDMGRYAVMGVRRLGAVNRTLPCVLPEESKDHRKLIARTESMLARPTVARTFRLR